MKNPIVNDLQKQLGDVQFAIRDRRSKIQELSEEIAKLSDKEAYLMRTIDVQKRFGGF